MATADGRGNERGEYLYLFFGKDGLQRDTAGSRGIIGENTCPCFRALRVPSHQRKSE